MTTFILVFCLLLQTAVQRPAAPPGGASQTKTRPAGQPQGGDPSAQTPEAPPPEPGIIEGQLVQSGTGAPVRSAQVTLRAPNDVVRSTYTDESGAFTLREIPPGIAFLMLNHPRFFGQPQNNVVVESGKTTKLPAIRMQALCVITGRVVDEDGAPLVFASIAVSAPGGSSQGMKGSANTDDQGEYRVWGIRPGKVVVRASYQPLSMGAPSGGAGDKSTAYASVYYPDSDDVAGASVMDLQPGAELMGIDFKLRKVSATSVSGTIQGPDGLWGGTLWLTPQGHAGSRPVDMSGPRVTASSNRPKFTLNGVRPGNYNLMIRGSAEMKQLYGSMPITVGREPVTGVQVTLSPLSTVSGTVRVEDDDNFKLEGLSFYLASVGESYGGANGRITPDGTFKAENVLPGKNWVILRHQQAYIKEIKTQRESTRDGMIDIPPGSDLTLELVIGTRSGKIHGNLTDDQGQPATGGATVLAIRAGAPADPRFWMMGAGGGPKGEYRIAGLAPGEYRVLALTRTQSLYEEAERIAALAQSEGKLVQISEGSDETTDLKVRTLETEKR